MAVCEVYSQSVKFKYKSTICSKSSVFSFCSTILSFILPLLIAYRSHGFWLKNSEFREQPKIRFKHDYFVYIETDEPDRPILCSNLPFTREFDRCTVIKSREEDHNRDGKHDELLFQVEIDVPSNVGIYNIQIILLFDYILQKQCLLQMESLGVIHYNSGIPGCKLDFTGDLKLVQKELLNTRGRDFRYNQSIFNINDGEYKLNINRIIRDYAKRIVSTKLDNSYYLWMSGALLGEPFKIDVHVNYPEETILYKPNFWQVMKWAWIQYFSLLFVFLNFFQWLKGYVFCNHLVPTIKEIPWKKNK